MKITESVDEIILRDIPFGHWAIGCIFVPFIGIIFVALIATAIEDPRNFFSSMGGGWLGYVFAFLSFLLIVGVILLALAGLFSFLLTPLRTTKINRKNESVEIETRSLIKNRTQLFYFSQIKKFAFDEIKTRGLSTYSIVLVLANNEQIKLEEQRRTAVKTEEIVQKLNSFIKLQI